MELEESPPIKKMEPEESPSIKKIEPEESTSLKKLEPKESPSIKKVGRENRIFMIYKIISGIFAIVGIIFIWIMASDFIEFASFIANLKQIYPSYVFNDPQVQRAIAQGYLELARMPLSVAIPMFILALVVFGVGKKVVNRIV